MKKILIIDTLSSSLEKKKEILSKPGFHVIGTTSSEEALTIIRGDTIDVIVSELDMPGMNGDDLCRAVRDDRDLNNISVIMIGFKSKASLERCRACGANNLLGKPLSPKMLYSSVSELLNIHGRESYRVLVKVSVRGKTKDQSFFCTSHNLSVSGVLLETTKLLSRGDAINCSFFIRGKNIKASGEIVRENKKPPDTYHYGVKFKDLSADALNVISAFVESRKSQ